MVVMCCGQENCLPIVAVVSFLCSASWEVPAVLTSPLSSWLWMANSFMTTVVPTFENEFSNRVQGWYGYFAVTANIK